jgi:ferritin-like protein
MEELEAIDWYDQRVAATADATLAEVLAHNRDEEKEHAAMTLEWLRRNDATLDRHLRTYLFTDADILEEEHAAEHGAGGAPAAAGDAAPSGDGSLGVGSLRSSASIQETT